MWLVMNVLAGVWPCFHKNKTNTDKIERKRTAVIENTAFGFGPGCYWQPHC